MATRRNRHRESGAAAVEAALVLCFIVIPLTFGIISYAYMLSFRQSLSQAAAEGARAAAVAPPSADTTAAAIAAVDSAVKSFGVSCNDGKLTCTPTTTTDCGTNGTGSNVGCVTVEVSYDYKDHPLMPTFPGLGIVMPSTLSYSASAEVN